MPLDTTRWSLVLAAGGDTSAAGAALATLCESYWYRLYAYVRRWGVDAEEARDLTQGFLVSLLERRDLAAGDRLARPHGGVAENPGLGADAVGARLQHRRHARRAGARRRVDDRPPARDRTT